MEGWMYEVEDVSNMAAESCSKLYSHPAMLTEKLCNVYATFGTVILEDVVLIAIFGELLYVL